MNAAVVLHLVTLLFVARGGIGGLLMHVALSGAIIGRKAGGKLIGALIAFASGRDPDQARGTIDSAMRTMHRFHPVQVGGLATMVLLGVFGPRS